MYYCIIRYRRQRYRLQRFHRCGVFVIVIVINKIIILIVIVLSTRYELNPHINNRDHRRLIYYRLRHRYLRDHNYHRLNCHR